MKGLLIALMLLASFSVKAQYVDGSYLANKNYGGPNDSTAKEVKAQIEAYASAKREAESIQSGEQEGDLRAAQQACVDTALYTWIKSCYLAEMGRLAAKSGDREQAIKDYTQALAWAKHAQVVDCNEEVKTAKSKEQGAIMEKVCIKALARLK